MIDLRYLALTLIGVFLALAVGLMTGSALGTPDRRDAAYAALRQQMDLLRADVERVREENETARRRLEAREQFGREVLPLAVRGRLAGVAVGIVVCGPLDERPFWGELEHALLLAGAQLGPVLRVPDTPRPLSALERVRLAPTPAALWATPEPEGADASFEAAGWAVAVMAQGDAARLRQLARLAGMELPRPSELPVRRLLVLTSLPDEARAAALRERQVPEFRILAAARQQRLRVVVAEPEESAFSAVSAFAAADVPTVDNIDTAPGRIAAILALAGAEGRFGSKPGAGRAVPPLSPP